MKTDQPNLNDSVNFRFNLILHFAFLAQLLKDAETFPWDQPSFLKYCITSNVTLKRKKILSIIFVPQIFHKIPVKLQMATYMYVNHSLQR